MRGQQKHTLAENITIIISYVGKIILVLFFIVNAIAVIFWAYKALFIMN